MNRFLDFEILKDRFLELRQALASYPFLHKVFLQKHGYPLDLKNPLTHNERINHKKIHDRNPLIPITSDKVRVRDYVREILGEKEANEILIPLFHISKTGKDIPHQSWDFEFFMKANHSSGGNMLVKPGTDPELIRKTCQTWLKSSYGQFLHEWAYRDIPRRITCEQVIRTPEGQIPADIKYYCFHGRPKMLMILTDRFGHQKRVFTDVQLNVIPGAQMYGKDMLYPLPDLPTHGRMLDFAAKLARDFTYCRVDFYTVGNKVYFGEITHYTGSGLEKFDDYDLDLAIGNLWLPENKDYSILEMLQLVKSRKNQLPKSKKSDHSKNQKSRSESTQSAHIT
ncbi:ATP-grasp fold amidoligase family protein [Algoriphagus sp. A40]|uniref:ATP-grasp fold amidoligase family protein n=1 Tax=Algoriphagus sp. A40 TaxID=1945863 RepID=UPI0009871D8B|nr:ATP-grasp fold amidoligase family protein [Algoriphagus sp. A40]OOG69892.1 hypothetical protein B0E43_19725 [Algoriphagus sp. A40]